MGQSQSFNFDIFPSSYTFESNINIPPYGSGKLLNHIANQQKIVQITLDSFNLNELINFANQLIARQNNIQSQYILRLMNWCIEDKIRILGGQEKISLFYEYCPYSLEKLIMQRQVTREIFSQEEILYLLYVISSVGEQLKIAGNAHKNIKPSTILFTLQNEIKLAPCGTFPYDIDALRAKKSLAQYSYLPPDEEMISNNNQINWNDYDTYATGLTLLDAMSLIFSYDLIEIENIELRKLLIQSRLLSLKYKYSPALILIVTKMLDRYETRFSLSEIYQYLLPFKENILLLQKVELPLKNYQNSQLSHFHIAPQQIQYTKEFKSSNRQNWHPFSPRQNPIIQKQINLVTHYSPPIQIAYTQKQQINLTKQKSQSQLTSVVRKFDQTLTREQRLNSGNFIPSNHSTIDKDDYIIKTDNKEEINEESKNFKFQSIQNSKIKFPMKLKGSSRRNSEFSTAKTKNKQTLQEYENQINNFMEETQERKQIN